MPNVAPFDRLIGPLTVYIAPDGETEPAVNTAPAGNWSVFGPTDGGQTLSYEGSIEYLRDDDHTGAVKGVRPEDDIILTTVIVGLTLENIAQILHDVANVTTDAGPPAIKTTPLKRDYNPPAYAMLLRGEAHSPYGDFPAQFYLPRGYFDGEPEVAFTKDEGAGIEIEFHVIADDTQAAGDEFGWMTAQTA